MFFLGFLNMKSNANKDGFEVMPTEIILPSFINGLIISTVVAYSVLLVIYLYYNLYEWEKFNRNNN